jgi:flagellin FlaB
MRFKKHSGLGFWYNTALITFGAVAVGLTWTVMQTGFSSSEAVKDTIEYAVLKSANSLLVVGKMTGAADVKNEKVMVTATPLTTTRDGIINVSPNNIRITYQLIADGSHTITYDNIYTGALYTKSYSSLKEALMAAKENGLISVNPLVDQQKPDTTTAFMYWIVNQDFGENVTANEIATLVIVYADKDRPSSKEYMRIQAIERDDVLVDIERTVPNVSSSIMDLGGKMKNNT